MTYAQIPRNLHETQVNEYFNTRTQRFEVIKKHGLADVQETFLMPDGRVLFLAYNAHAVHPYVVGIYNSDHGVHMADGADARRQYAWQIAESYGLVVDKEGSKAIVPASRQHITELGRMIRKQADEITEGDLDEVELEEAAEALAKDSTSLVKHLQRTGVLTENVYASWDVTG